MFAAMTKAAITLHTNPRSGHAHRAQLFLSLLGLPHELKFVDLRAGEQKQPEFLRKNPLGQVPVLEDGDVVVADSNAILIYLALRYDEAGKWYPRDPVGAARVQRWLSLAAGELAFGPSALRRTALIGTPVDRPSAERLTGNLFGLLERELGTQPYLLGQTPTLADVALYSYTARAPEGGVSLEPYPALRAWLARVEALPGFVPFQQTKVG